MLRPPLLTICVIATPLQIAAQRRLMQNLETQSNWIIDSIPGYGGYDSGLPKPPPVQIIARCSRDSTADKVAYCMGRAAGQFVVFLDSSVWVSQHYVRVVTDAIMQAAPTTYALTYKRCSPVTLQSRWVPVGLRTPRRNGRTDGQVVYLDRELIFSE